ncbi:MAG: sulfotransferase [Gammaproteobacteria bacterium]
MDNIERFVVNASRSGSTLLSRMLGEDPGTLSLSEFFGAFDSRLRLAQRPLTGAEFAVALCGTDEIGLLGLTRGFLIKDIHHEFQATPQDLQRWGVKYQPALFAMALPSLSDKPVAYLDELVAYARAQPAQGFPDHCRSLWRWMGESLGKKAWVERTGASLRWVPELCRAFPDALYVHIHRDGPETALSMRNHNWGILAAELFERPPSMEDLEEAVRNPQPGDADRFGRFFGKDLPPVETYGHYWSYLICNGYSAFRHLRPEQVLDVRFEDLEAHPRRELLRIAEFFRLPGDRDWIDQAASLVTGGRVQPRAPALPQEERSRLEKACLPGQVLLGRVDPAWAYEPYRRIREVFDRHS